MLRFAFAASSALFASSALAQLPAAPVQPAVAPAQVAVLGASATNMLRTGMTIPMRTRVALTTKNKVLKVGERVPLEVAEDVRLNGQVVIPAGSPGMGEIIEVRNKGMWGKSGYFNGRVLHIRVGDRQIRMSGTFNDKGKAGGGAAAATSAIVFLPAGFFMTGTSAQLPVGAPITGFLDEDIPVAFAAAPAPAPLTVAAPAPVQMTAAPTVVAAPTNQAVATPAVLNK